MTCEKLSLGCLSQIKEPGGGSLDWKAFGRSVKTEKVHRLVLKKNYGLGHCDGGLSSFLRLV